MKGTQERGRRTVFGVYAAHALRYRWLLFGIIVMNITMACAALAAPVYLRTFINTLAMGDTSDVVVSSLLATLAIIISFWVLDWLAHRVQYVLTMYLEVGVMTDLYHSSFKYLLGHSYNFFISRFAGTLTHKVTKFARAFELLFDGVTNQFFPTTIFTVGAIIVVTVHNKTLGLILGVWVVCFLIFQIYVSRLRQPVRIERSEADSRVTGNLADAISNQTTIVLFSGARFEATRFARTVAVWANALYRTWIADSWIWSGIGLFILVIQAALFYGGIVFWQKGLFTIGDFVLIQSYLLSTFRSMEQMNRDLRKMGDAYSDAVEMVEILDEVHEIRDAAHAEPLAVAEGVVEFKDVDFHFQEERGVFANFNMCVQGGEKVALIGPSGAGKSTITKLILRLFDVKKGAILIDEEDVRDVTQESLRNAIGFVPQEPILFHRTLMENIRYGRRDATDAEVLEAAKQAYCHEFISRLPLGYDTYVGERGVKLSGGERQRVAIARAILKNAPILVLDEATSSLDSESEVFIQRALANLMHGKTVIVIAHRLSTIMKMDRIIALDDGAVVEEGTHQELLAKRGLYAKLWSHQAGGFLQDEA
ncbi:MAG: ABC transporter ATP-binding protein [Minisyncoccia bacterium]